MLSETEHESDIWVQLFDSDLIPLRREGEGGGAQQRTVIYRAMLFLMVFSATVVTIEALFFGQLSSLLLMAATTVLLVQLATLLRLLLAGAVLLPPLITLIMSLLLVTGAISQGADHHTLLLFPLMIAIAALLPTRVALALGLLTMAAVVLARGDTVATFDLAEDTALLATWLLSLSVMRMMSREAHAGTDMALTDSLTGAFNRRYLVPQTDRCIEDYRRYARLSTLLMIDLDHFQQVNDQFGHAMGDQVLAAMVRLIEDRLRGVDMVFRVGGEKFVVLLAETGAISAKKVAEELRELIAELDVLPHRSITVSIGVCDVSSVSSTEDWLEQVDKALYQAKSEGRDRVVAVANKVVAPTQISSTIPIWR